MKLYLHCGYHKTGSSFLQTLFSRNRKYLQECGYHFPVGEREYDMLSGNISPGNGEELAGALKATEKRYVNQLIIDCLSEARKWKCSSILLSSENFFHAFENQQSLQLLMSVAKENNIDSIHALLYFRDPVPHALSTFKHRAKNGRISDLSNWLDTEYETMGLIQKFMEYHTQYSINWTCRKYSSQSEHMATSTFADWLGVNTPTIPDDDRVNTSLTLSELLAMQSLNIQRPAYIPFVREAFAALPGNEKAAEKELNSRYNAIASRKLIENKPLIEKVNRLLPENEQLKLMSPTELVDHTQQDTIALSKEQIVAFMSGIEAGAKADRLMHKSKAILMKVADRVNRKLKTLTV